MAWRYIAMRLDRKGGMVPLEWNVPATGVSITDVLSGPPALDFEVTPEVARLQTADDLPLFKKWSTAVFAEEAGIIRGGGIVTDLGVNGGQLTVGCAGFSAYPHGMPYRSSRFWVQVDPLDVFRHVWNHLQDQEDGDLGVVCDMTKTGLKIGTELKQVEFDTQSGPVSFEAGPVKLNEYESHDLGKFQDDLASQYGFDWHEEHRWTGVGDQIEHRIRIGYPRLGRRREDLRFAYGENIAATPALTGAGDEYANGVLMLGRGEGRTMVRTLEYRDDGALRRIAVVEDKTIASKNRITTAAKRHLAARRGLWSVRTFNVRNDSHAPLGHYGPGDDILVTIDEGWAKVETWFRVLSITYSPEELDEVTVTVQRVDALEPA